MMSSRGPMGPLRVLGLEQSALEASLEHLAAGEDGDLEPRELADQAREDGGGLAGLGPNPEPVVDDGLDADLVEELTQLRSSQTLERRAHEAAVPSDALHELIRLEGVREVASLAP